MPDRLFFKYRTVNFLDYKTAEIYSRIYYDFIAKNFFTVIKEAKYNDGSDVFRASIDYQKDAYKVEDFDYKKSEDIAGIATSFPTLKEADRFLKKQVEIYFEYKLRDTALEKLTFRNRKNSKIIEQKNK